MPPTRSRARGGKPPAPPPAAPSAKRRAKAPAGGSRDAKRRTPGAGAGSTGAGANKVVYPNKNDPKSDPFHAVGFVNMNDMNTMWAARLLLARLVVSSTPAPLLSDADVPERGMPCAAHVRGPSIMREINDEQCRFHDQVLEIQVRCCAIARPETAEQASYRGGLADAS